MESTEIYCESLNTRDAMYNYILDQIRQDEEFTLDHDVKILKLGPDQATIPCQSIALRIEYDKHSHYTNAIDSQLIGFRDGYEERQQHKNNRKLSAVFNHNRKPANK